MPETKQTTETLTETKPVESSQGMQFIESIVEIEEIAKEEGIDTSDWTDDELIAWNENKLNEPIKEIKSSPDAKTDKEEKPIPDAKTDKIEEEPENIEIGKYKEIEGKLKKTEEMYKNYRSLNDKQMQELGTLRQTVQNVQPLLEELNRNPDFQRHIYNFFQNPNPSLNETGEIDTSNPEYIDKLVDKKLSERERMTRQNIDMQQKKNIITTFQSNYEKGLRELRDDLISKGYSEIDVNNAVSDFWNNFNKGNLSLIIKDRISKDKEIIEAEKRGAEAERKKFTESKNESKRSISTEIGRAKKSSTEPVTYKECQSKEELDEYIRKLPSLSDEWLSAVAFREDSYGEK